MIEDRLSRVLAYSKLQQPADTALVATIMGGCAPQRLRAFFEARGVFAHLAAPTSPTDTIAVQARWVAAGTEHTGAVKAQSTTKTGDLVEIWVDNDGFPSTPRHRALRRDGGGVGRTHAVDRHGRRGSDPVHRTPSSTASATPDGNAISTTWSATATGTPPATHDGLTQIAPPMRADGGRP